MVKREGSSKKSRDLLIRQPARLAEDVPYGWPGEPRSKDRKKRAMWSSVLMSSVIARLF